MLETHGQNLQAHIARHGIPTLTASEASQISLMERSAHLRGGMRMVNERLATLENALRGPLPQATVMNGSEEIPTVDDQLSRADEELALALHRLEGLLLLVAGK